MVVFGRLVNLRQLLKAVVVVLASLNVLSLLTLIARPRKIWQLSKEMLASFNELVRRDPIPESRLSDLVDGATDDVAVSLSLDRELSITPAEILCVCTLAKIVRPRNVLEIGTYKGVTAYHIARNTDESCRIYTIDLPETYGAGAAVAEARTTGRPCTDLPMVGGRPRRDELCYVGTDVEHKIVQIYHDSTSLDYESHFPEKFDLIFIDGSHDYEHVRIDSNNALRWIADGGLILWHDYRSYSEITYGVKRCLRQLRKEHDVRRLAGTSLCVLRKRT